MAKNLRFGLLLVTVFCLSWPGFCLAHENEQVIGDTTFNIGSWELEWIPDTTAYPIYVADPKRPRMQVAVGFIDSEIPDTTSSMINLNAGTRIPVLRMQRDAQGANALVLDVEGGIFTRFNMLSGMDNVGWDGRYGIYLARNWGDAFAARFGYSHVSAHLGDDYIEETGRSRIGYIRDDCRLGISVHPIESLALYVEPSYAWHMGNTDRQEQWAVEGGAQYQGPYTLWKNSMAWYAGVHVAAYQEDGWNPSLAGQVGLILKRDPKQTRMRLGLEGYTGRSILGEFALDYNESYLTAGLYFDFF